MVVSLQPDSHCLAPAMPPALSVVSRTSLRRDFGRVAVWTVDGAGPGNAKLIDLGGVPVGNADDLLDIDAVETAGTAVKQTSLFD
jgi:hypothetical protein